MVLRFKGARGKVHQEILTPNKALSPPPRCTTVKVGNMNTVKEG
jgi:hypothetical protein